MSVDRPELPLVRQYNYGTLKWGGGLFAFFGLFGLVSGAVTGEKLVFSLLFGSMLFGLGVLLISISIRWREEWEMDEIGITYRQGGRTCAYLRLDEIQRLWVGDAGLTVEGSPDQFAIHFCSEVHKPFLERLRLLARFEKSQPGQQESKPAPTADTITELVDLAQLPQLVKTAPTADADSALVDLARFPQLVKTAPEDPGSEPAPPLPLVHNRPRRIWLELVLLMLFGGGLSVVSAYLWLNPSFLRLANERPRDRERREVMKYLCPGLAVLVVLGYLFGPGPMHEFRVDADGLEIHDRVSRSRYAWRDLSWVAFGRQDSQRILVVGTRKGLKMHFNLGDRAPEFMNTILAVAARNGVDLTHRL